MKIADSIRTKYYACTLSPVATVPHHKAKNRYYVRKYLARAKLLILTQQPLLTHAIVTYRADQNYYNISCPCVTPQITFLSEFCRKILSTFEWQKYI